MALSDFVARGLGRLRRELGIKARFELSDFEVKKENIASAQRQASELDSLFYSHEGPVVHKWCHYLPIYDRHLARFRGTAVRLLEIGVSEGGSLALWRKYFGPDAIVFGVDIDPRCRALDGRDGQVRIGSQADAKFLAATLAEMGGVDVVIDDGSHIASHQRKSFAYLWPQLSPHGVYICEDLHTSYWRGAYEGGYRRGTSFIEIAKRMIDDIHADFHRHGESVKGASRTVDGVHFYNSMVVIEKHPQTAPAHVHVGNVRRNGSA